MQCISVVDPVTSQLENIRKLRIETIARLQEIAKEFPMDRHVIIHVSHGNVRKQIVKIAERHGCDMIILGKRVMSTMEKLTSR